MIDVLRGFAALSVLVYHVIEHFKWDAFPVRGPLVWFRIGWMGVDLFFVISGFVIALSAFAQIDKSGAEFRRSFVVHRIARIVPLHYLTCVVFIGLVAPNMVRRDGFWSDLGIHLLFAHNLSVNHVGSINGANWSVATEMQFYLAILVWAPALRIAPWWVIAFVMTGCAWTWRWHAFRDVGIHGPVDTQSLWCMSALLPGTLDEFAAGILLARFVRSSWGGRLQSDGRRYLLPVALAAAVTTWVALWFFWGRAAYWDSAIMVIFYRSLLALACVLVVLAACCIQGPRTMAVTAPMRYLGTISYGLYLWHLVVILKLRSVHGLSPARALPAAIAITILLAAASWHVFERPILQWAKKR